MKQNLQAGTARGQIGVKDENRLHDPLYARVLILDDSEERFAVIALDAVAVGCIFDLSDAFLPALRKRLATLGFQPYSMIVSATHTHTEAPMLRREEEVIDICFDAVKRACENLVPVVTGSGSGSNDRIIMNRTLRLSNGRHWTIRHTNCSPPDDLVNSLGKVDPEIGVIRIDRATDGTPLAVLFNYGCHPLIGVPSGQVTANFPGVACDRIETVLGNGCTAMFLQGSGGDVIEVLNKDFSAPRKPETFGRILADDVLDIYRTVRPSCTGFRCKTLTAEFPRRDDGNEKIAALHAEERRLLASLRYTALNFKTFLPLYIAALHSPEYPSAERYRYLQEEAVGEDALVNLDRLNRKNMDKYLANIRAMEVLARIQDEIATFERHRDYNLASHAKTISAEMTALRLGDCILLSTPVELVSEAGLRLKKYSPFAKTFLAAYANGYMHYGPMPEDYDKGGYEATECFLAPGWHGIFEKTALQLLNDLYKE